MGRNRLFAPSILLALFIVLLLLVDLYITQTPAVYAQSKKLTWNVPKGSQSSASKQGSKWFWFGGQGGGIGVTGVMPKLCPSLLTSDLESRFWAATPSGKILLDSGSHFDYSNGEIILNDADEADPAMLAVELCQGELEPLPNVYLERPDGSQVNLLLSIRREYESSSENLRTFFLYQLAPSDPAGEYKLHFEDGTESFVLTYNLIHDERAPRFLLMDSEQGLEKHVYYPTETLDMMFYEIHAGQPVDLELYKRLDSDGWVYEIIADEVITPASELDSGLIFSYTVQLPLENLEPGQYMLAASAPEETVADAGVLSFLLNPNFTAIPAQYFYRQHFDIAEPDAPILQVGDAITQNFPEDAETVSHYFWAREGEHLRITANVSSPTESEGFHSEERAETQDDWDDWSSPTEIERFDLTVSEPGDLSNIPVRHLEYLAGGNTLEDVIATKTDVYKVTLHKSGSSAQVVYDLAIENIPPPQQIVMDEFITGRYSTADGPTYYTFVGDAGARLKITMDIISDTALDDPPFSLSDEAGNPITPLEPEDSLQQTGRVFTSDYRLPFSGTFRLVVYPGGQVDEGFDYRFSVTEISKLTAEDPLNNEPGPVCVHEAGFVDDITIPDGMRVPRGTELVKVWRIRNTGNCTWGPSHVLNMLVFDSGNPLSSISEVPLPHAVPPGAVVDIAVPIVTPDIPGRYRSNWKLRTSDGVVIGFGARGVAPLYVEIEVLQ